MNRRIELALAPSDSVLPEIMLTYDINFVDRNLTSANSRKTSKSSKTKVPNASKSRPCCTPRSGILSLRAALLHEENDSRPDQISLARDLACAILTP